MRPPPEERYRWEPDYVIPTSVVLKEWLDENGLSVRVAVACLPPERRETAAAAMQAVLNGAAFTEETVGVLVATTGISRNFWTSFEHNYREGLAAGKSVM